VTPGICQLCDRLGELVESDIWPRFGYKLYAADQSQGGVFADLHEMKLHGKRLTKPLFCKKCDNEALSRFENKAAKFCRELAKSPTSAIAYEDWLLPFLTSLSLRTILHEPPLPGDESAYRPAVRQWKQFILGKRGNVGLYSQHLFIVFDREAQSHMGMCGWRRADKNFVFTQFGPLWTVGILGRKKLSLREIRAWHHSQILPAAGTIHPVTKWHENVNVSSDFLYFLIERHHVAIQKAVEYTAKQKEKTAKKQTRVLS
jgi:hypothetical protein